MFCPECGHSNEKGSKFCGGCGKTFQTSSKSRLTPLQLGIIASALVFLVMVATIVIGFIPVKSANVVTNKQLPSAEEAAAQYYQAISRRDVQNLMVLVDPDFMDKFKQENPEEYEEWAEDYFFGEMPEDIDFRGLEHKVNVDENTATVKLKGGTAVYEDACGKQTEEEADKFLPSEITLVKRGNSWYIAVPEGEI